MTEPTCARRDEEAEWLPRCCQAWIVEQTRADSRRGPDSTARKPARAERGALAAQCATATTPGKTHS